VADAAVRCGPRTSQPVAVLIGVDPPASGLPGHQPRPRPASSSQAPGSRCSGSSGLLSWTSTRTASSPSKTIRPIPAAVVGVCVIALVTSSPASRTTTSIRMSSCQPCRVASTNRLAARPRHPDARWCGPHPQWRPSAPSSTPRRGAPGDRRTLVRPGVGVPQYARNAMQPATSSPTCTAPSLSVRDSPVTFHALQHTAATLLLSEGEHPRVVHGMHRSASRSTATAT
jgi:hypothetical protein